MEISEIMRELRSALDAAGIEWRDASEEFLYGDGDRAVYHMERTKVIDGDSEAASVIWGYSGIVGRETGSTCGWPDSLEVGSLYLGTAEPQPMSVEGCVALVIGKGESR